MEDNIGIRRVEFCRVDFFIERDGVQFARPVLLKPRIARIADNCKKPRPSVTATKSVQKFECPQARFLDDVFCITIIVHEPPGEIVCGIQMWLYYHLIFLSFIFSLEHSTYFLP